MFNRERALIFEGEHWDLYLHDKQYPYIGRCFLRYKFDSKGRPLAKLPRAAQRERKKLEERVAATCEWLGYDTHPGHEKFILEIDEHAREEYGNYIEEHLIPRNGRINLTHQGIVFKDLAWGKPYNDPRWFDEHEVPEKVFVSIRDRMKEFLFFI